MGNACDDTGQSHGLRRSDAGGRPPTVPTTALAGRADRFTGAVYPVRRLCRSRRRIWLGQVVRRVFRAGRILCRHDDARIRPQSQSCGGIPAAPGRVFRAVLRIGGHVVRSASADRATDEGPGGSGNYHFRQNARRDRPGPGVPLPTEHRAYGGRQSGADRGVLVHPRGTGSGTRAAVDRGAESDSCRSTDLHRAEFASLRGHRTGSKMGSREIQCRKSPGAQR